MKTWLQKNIVYFIALIILVTLFIQAYWNIKNYEANKTTVNNEVLAALNNSVDSYYTNLAKSDIKSSINHENVLTGKNVPGNIKSMIDTMIIGMDITEDMIRDNPPSGRNIVHFMDEDTTEPVAVDITEMLKKEKASRKITASATVSGSVADADTVVNITTLATKIIISLSSDNINFEELTKYIDEELKRKGFDFKYALSLTRENQKTVNYKNPKDPGYELSVESRSAYLPSGSHLKMYYPNINLIALKESFAGMALSFLFTLAIIASLSYLLKMIREQRQIVLSKNDFISNISHELKTPIATSFSALEAIQNFNASNDTEKTEKYMGIAAQQLQKLNVMVEKILDTASLESNQLALHKEAVNIVPLLQSAIEKQQISTSKHISFITKSDIIHANIDVFHFENVINNIIENAVKYGGNSITVYLQLLPIMKQAEISISDDGNPIDKSQRNKIFDKFYRVPTSNRHDIKGYGIGLYYSKNIIEKHGGKLMLLDDSKLTVFKITVPYV